MEESVANFDPQALCHLLCLLGVAKVDEKTACQQLLAKRILLSTLSNELSSFWSKACCSVAYIGVMIFQEQTLNAVTLGSSMELTTELD
ncbi:hypothetical protein E5288_WYG000010 [Bos mutus]|uniref:Uncharacterized protein n=1 Tax=Bos mutus TaxID=72004 RepID=A0A6B0REQ3_9CETA|nr:hypothetical protein [Bos mutus]